jgi:hypothetical protein
MRTQHVREKSRIRDRDPERKAKKIQREKEKNRSTIGRKNHRKLWKETDIARLFCDALTDTQLAKEMGRSIHAITQARLRYAIFAPDGYKTKASQRIDEPQTQNQEVPNDS